MTAPIFPGTEDLLSLIFGELPEGVFPEDRANNPDTTKNSYSSAELRAHAQMFAQLYANLENAYLDRFLTTVTPAGLAPWERELFSSSQDSTQSYTTRQQNLLAKFRAVGGISLPAIQAVVAGILGPVGLAFQILPYSGQSNGTITGAWVLDFSELGLSTFLSLEDPILGAKQGGGLVPLDCSLNYAAAGITAQDLLNIQATAYTYEVQIFGTADAQTLFSLNAALTALEPARSTHIISNNVSQAPADPTIYGWNTNYLPWMTL